MRKLTYAETIRVVTTIDRAAGRARELKDRLLATGSLALRVYLSQTVDMADELHAALPDMSATTPPMAAAPESLDQAVLDCRIRLGIMSDYRHELGWVHDEASLITLSNRARALAAQLSMIAKAGLDLATTEEAAS